MRALNYIQQFNLKIQYKLNAQHIILNVFSRLFSLNINEKKR